MAKDFKTVALAALSKVRSIEKTEEGIQFVAGILLEPTFNNCLRIATSISEKARDNGYWFDEETRGRQYALAFALKLVEKEVPKSMGSMAMNIAMKIEDHLNEDAGSYCVYWFTCRGDAKKVWEKMIEKARIRVNVLQDMKRDPVQQEKSLRRYEMRLAFYRKNSENSEF